MVDSNQAPVREGSMILRHRRVIAVRDCVGNGHGDVVDSSLLPRWVVGPDKSLDVLRCHGIETSSWTAPS